jgi:hypothetical protein
MQGEHSTIRRILGFELEIDIDAFAVSEFVTEFDSRRLSDGINDTFV